MIAGLVIKSNVFCVFFYKANQKKVWCLLNGETNGTIAAFSKKCRPLKKQPVAFFAAPVSLRLPVFCL